MDIFDFAIRHWPLVSALLVLIIILIVTEGRRVGLRFSPSSLVQAMNQDHAIVIDLRDQKLFAQGHITDSEHCSYASAKDRLPEWLKQTQSGKTIIFVDEMGTHSSTVAKMLFALGSRRHGVLQGGISTWRTQQLPLVK
ncbi:MAG: rhodanese-like domain-containing protein [Pseudomonadota bacterium]